MLEVLTSSVPDNKAISQSTDTFLDDFVHRLLPKYPSAYVLVAAWKLYWVALHCILVVPGPSTDILRRWSLIGSARALEHGSSPACLMQLYLSITKRLALHFSPSLTPNIGSCPLSADAWAECRMSLGGVLSLHYSCSRRSNCCPARLFAAQGRASRRTFGCCTLQYSLSQTCTKQL